MSINFSLKKKYIFHNRCSQTSTSIVSSKYILYSHRAWKTDRRSQIFRQDQLEWQFGRQCSHSALYEIFYGEFYKRKIQFRTCTI